MKKTFKLCVAAIRLIGYVTMPCAGLLSTTIGAAELPQVIAAGVPKVKPGTSIAALKLGPNFYQPPRMPFITQDGEQVIPVELETCTGAEAQKILDNERTYVPDGE
jgi:hypothetical protein